MFKTKTFWSEEPMKIWSTQKEFNPLTNKKHQSRTQNPQGFNILARSWVRIGTFSQKNFLPMQTTAVRKTIDSKLNLLFDKSGTVFHPALSSWWFLACPDGKIPEDLTILTPRIINSWNLKKILQFVWKGENHLKHPPNQTHDLLGVLTQVFRWPMKVSPWKDANACVVASRVVWV